jgi:hypothetical protein
MGACVPEPACGLAPARYVLQAQDGRMVTNDRAIGPYLTATPALAYTWSTQGEADGQRLTYEQALGVTLEVVAKGR